MKKYPGNLEVLIISNDKEFYIIKHPAEITGKIGQHKVIIELVKTYSVGILDYKEIPVELQKKYNEVVNSNNIVNLESLCKPYKGDMA